jgi:hypothetical protein
MSAERSEHLVEALRDYAIHVSATALICALLLRFADSSGTVRGILRLLCSLILTYSIIQPFRQFEIPELGNFVEQYKEEAELAVQQGKKVSSNAFSERISTGVEAYILEKSSGLNLDLVVEVELSDDEIPVPVAVSLTGNVSPYNKLILSNTISNDLNIPKEKQIWISQ